MLRALKTSTKTLEQAETSSSGHTAGGRWHVEKFNHFSGDYSTLDTKACKYVYIVHMYACTSMYEYVIHDPRSLNK